MRKSDSSRKRALLELALPAIGAIALFGLTATANAAAVPVTFAQAIESSANTNPNAFAYNNNGVGSDAEFGTSAAGVLGAAIPIDFTYLAGSGVTTADLIGVQNATIRTLAVPDLTTTVLTMTVTERARDIAVLMALGSRRRQVRRIFVLQGLVVSVAGTAAGLAAGYGFSWVANRWRLIPLNPEIYAIPYVPFHGNSFDAIWIAAAALAISVAATIVPARSAARILPVEILRFE